MHRERVQLMTTGTFSTVAWSFSWDDSSSGWTIGDKFTPTATGTLDQAVTMTEPPA